MDSSELIRKNESDFYTLLSGLLRAFSNRTSDEIKTCIQNSLIEACTIFGANAAVIIQISQESGEWIRRFDYRFSAVGKSDPHDSTQIPFWIQKKILDGQEISSSDVDEHQGARPEKVQFWDGSGGETLLAVPLIGQETQVCGFFGLFSAGNGLSEEQRSQIRTLCRVYAAVLERMDDEAERENLKKYHTSLNSFIQIALETDDYNETLGRFSKKLSEMSHSDVSGFGLWDDEKQMVYPAGVYGATQKELLSLRLEFGDETLTKLSQKCGDYLIIENLSQSEYRNFKVIQSIPVSTVIVLPMVSHDDILGSAFIGFRQAHTLTEQELDQIKQAVEQITLVLAKVQLLESRRRYIDKLNTISQFSVAMRNAQSLAEIPGMIMKKVIELCDVDDVALVFLDSEKETRELFQCGKEWQEISQEEFFTEYSFIEEVIRDGVIKKVPDLEKNTR